jgi:hypothetical protein
MSDSSSPPPPPKRPPSHPSWFRRFVGVAGPGVLLGTVVYSMIWGNNGIIARNELRQLAVESEQEKSAIDLKNQYLIRQIELMGSDHALDGSGSVGVDPVIIERLAAEELHWGKPGTVLYTFEP